MHQHIEALRAIRTTKPINLPKSVYVKTNLVDEFGGLTELVIRDYQLRGIANLLLVPRFILGDDTGIGKTLQVLVAIAHVWAKEPDYVPIIVVPKSALLQWQGEVYKFLNDVDPVVVSGIPQKRHKVYEKFFSEKTSKKRILILTYDNIMADLEESVIKLMDIKPRPGLRKELKETKTKLEGEKTVFATINLSVLTSRNYDTEIFINSRLKGDFPPSPVGWTVEDEKLLKFFISQKAIVEGLQQKLQDLKNELHPAVKAPGFLHHVQQFKKSHPNVKFMLIMDEIHRLKNHKSQIHEKTRSVSFECDRLIGMTATPIKNKLMEFFALFRIIEPSLFPKITHFQNDYCVVKLQRISGGRKIPIVVGYKNLDQFSAKIEPYYLSRKKYDVAKELPDLISVDVYVELSDLEDELYGLYESGAMDADEEDSSSVLSALTRCRQATDSPELLKDENGDPFEGPSSKMDALLDILENTEGKKVIIFSLLEQMISLIGKRLEKEKIKYVRITGAENDPKKRREAQTVFQNPDSGTDVILITTAGAESLNLQAAEHFVFIDHPWAFGDYVQLIGRMIRIGSIHKTVICHHLLARRQDGSKTIDDHVLKLLKAKKNLADKVSGESVKGGLQLIKEDAVRDILNSIKQGKPYEPPKKGSPKNRLKKADEGPRIIDQSIDFGEL